ncbi:MAG: enoyl-CoA hydratase [Gammaproteobacteria bacterium]|jgi:enoyl-CoA hydratase
MLSVNGNVPGPGADGPRYAQELVMQLNTDRMIARKADGIGWMIFNNPARRNAISLAMREAMADIFHSYNQDDDVRVLIMTGAGDKAFVSGADISEFKEKRNNAQMQAEYAKVSQRAGDAMRDFDKPIIAMIQGFCIGGGLATALGADLRIASDDSQFGIPAAKLGLGYSLSQVKMLADVVGPAYANEILFTGRRYGADKAFEMGLLNRITTVTDLESTVLEYAQEIANNAPLTIKAAKATIRELYRQEEPDQARVDSLLKACFDSEDYLEGRNAFTEKRAPVFKGR